MYLSTTTHFSPTSRHSHFEAELSVSLSLRASHYTMVNPCSISIPIIKTPLLFSLLFASFIAFAYAANNVTYDHHSLIIDGQRKLLISASVHYPRSVPADKKSLKLGPDDHLHLEGFASNVFAEADKQDRAGGADLDTAKTFYAASIFFEIRNQFGDFQPDLEQKQKYAAWKAADIRKALKEGRKPIPGPADGDKDLSILSSTSSGEYDLELSRSDPAIKPALEPDQLHQSYDEIPPSPSNNSPSLPSYPTASYPSHDFHPPPSTNRSENSTYSQPYHHQPYPREPQQHFPQNYPSHEISSPSYPNFQSYPSFTETSLPDAPSNHHSYHQGSDATYSTLSASTTTNYPSTTHYNSSSRNGTGLEAAPNSVQMYEYDSNYQPPPEKIAEAHKAARFAVGALAFDDISVAVDHLKKSLELLTNPSASQHKGDESGRRRKRGDDLDESLSRRTERRRRRGKATNGEATEARQGDGEATGAARDEQTESARDE